MNSRVRAAVLALCAVLALVASAAVFGAAAAQASAPLSMTSAIQRGSTWLTFSDTPTYANEPKVLPGTYQFRLTLTNRTSSSLGITSATIGIAGTPTTCATGTIKPGHSGSCTVPVTIVAGPTSFSTTAYLSNLQTFTTAQHTVIGVSYDLTTTMTLTTPGGTVSPGDPALLQLPLGYRPVASLTIRNSSTVNITSVTVPGFNTSACAAALKTIRPNTQVLCVSVPVVRAAATNLTALNTGAVGNGVFTGDRPGLGIALSYQGVGGCTASLASVTAGQQQTVSCTGFDPGIVVGAVQHSVPVSVGTHRVAGDGTLDFRYVVPRTTSGGSHVLSITVAGSTVATTNAFSVTALALPVTGTDPGPLLGAALALLGVGALLFAVRPRARRH